MKHPQAMRGKPGGAAQRGSVMKNILLACTALAVFAGSAPAQDLPSLSSFLMQCARDTTVCRAKMRDYITAADTQHSICRPADQSVGEAASALLSWLRSDQRPDSLSNAPYDDALWQGASTMWPCKPAEPPPPPPAPADGTAAPASPSTGGQ